jgi:hypothetical protein
MTSSCDISTDIPTKTASAPRHDPTGVSRSVVQYGNYDILYLDFSINLPNGNKIAHLIFVNAVWGHIWGRELADLGAQQ